jgi:hypothetical protein
MNAIDYARQCGQPESLTMKQPVRKQPNTPSGAVSGLSFHDVGPHKRGRAHTPRSAESVDATVTPNTCGWCLGTHPTHACPRGPKLSVRSVVAFVVAAMGRPARGWS